MEFAKKKVITSAPFDNIDLLDIYEYGEATFGQKLAEGFISEIYQSLGKLETQYLLHPECRHLETKTKIYRNINFGFLFNYLQNQSKPNSSIASISWKSFSKNN